MNMKYLMPAVFAAALSVASPAHADVITVPLDDFNRPSNNPLGANWTQVAGAATIQGMAATGTNGALATYNGVAASSVTFDIQNIGNATQYIAAILGYGGGQNLFIKVQNNGGSGSTSFDTYAFYTGNNGSGFFGNLSSSFKQGSVTASYLNSIATLSITPTNGIAQTYTHNYGFTPTGNGIGLGFFGKARADNFSASLLSAAVPEPATWAMMILGFGLVGGAMRTTRRQSLRVAYT